MKCSEAVKILDAILDCVKPGDPPEEHTAINLAIASLHFRIQMKNNWQFSDFARFQNETDEREPPPAR